MKARVRKTDNVAEFLDELKKAIKVIEAHPEMLLSSEETVDYEPVDIEGDPVPLYIPLNYSMKITLDLDWDKYAKETKTEGRKAGECIGLILMGGVAGGAFYMFVTGFLELLGWLHV